MVGMVCLLVGESIMMLRARAPDPAASLTADHNTSEYWSAREAALRERLRVSPADDGCRLRLIGVLKAQALRSAQDSSGVWAFETTPDAAGAVPYDEQLAQELQLSPQLAEARQLAEKVAKESPDRRLRGDAWAELALMQGLLGRPEEGMACMEAAAREDPAWRETLARFSGYGRRALPGGEYERRERPAGEPLPAPRRRGAD